jgi:hypothetical protein
MSEPTDHPIQVDADALLSGTAVEAGVTALANRNQHHLADMDENERENAVGHWRELAVEVLNAARASLVGDQDAGIEGGGRAVVVFEDAGNEEVAVHVTFAPQLEDLGDGSVAGTPAQLAAMSFLESLTPDADDGIGPEPPA